MAPARRSQRQRAQSEGETGADGCTAGLACWMCGAEFINRRSKTSHADINLMGARARQEGKKLMIFPEGTRNGAKGLSMLPFKKGAFHIAINGKLPIQPIVISEYYFLDWKKMIFNP